MRRRSGREEVKSAAACLRDAGSVQASRRSPSLRRRGRLPLAILERLGDLAARAHEPQSRRPVLLDPGVVPVLHQALDNRADAALRDDARLVLGLGAANPSSGGRRTSHTNRRIGAP